MTKLTFESLCRKNRKLVLSALTHAYAYAVNRSQKEWSESGQAKWHINSSDYFRLRAQLMEAK